MNAIIIQAGPTTTPEPPMPKPIIQATAPASAVWPT